MIGVGSLAGQVVVVTGGTQGLGEATARLAVERGASGVAIVGRDTTHGDLVAGELKAAGAEALFVAVDLADSDAADRVFAAVDQRFGVVHGLVNSAAQTDRGSVWDTTAALIDRLMAVNVRAPMLLLQAAARIMKREGVPGSIVNIGSVASYGSEVFLFPYATSKSALHAMTRNAAFALARDRIRVNLLNPGWMDTPGEDAIQRRYHDAGDDWLERAEAEQPFGRLLKADEVARGICFLLSAESGMMTGACLDFDQTVIGAGKGPIPTERDVWP